MPNSTIQRTERGLSIHGTRLTLYDILAHLDAGWSPQLIRQWFSLTADDIDAIMTYIADHRDAVYAEYQQVLQQAEKNRQYWEERNREKLAYTAELPPIEGKEALIEKLRQRKKELDMS